MDHSLIGKPSLRVGLVMGLLMGLCSVLLLAACGGGNSAKGGAGQEHNKSKSGGTAPNKSTRSFAGPPSWLPGPASLAACGGGNSAKGGAGGEHNKSTRSFAGPASTDGLIVFRRDIDSEGIPNLPYTSCKSAIFTMYPNGSHIRQITHPPEGWSAAAPKGLSDDSPAWSPDGTKVAFHRWCRLFHCHEHWIMVVDVNTGVTRSVTPCKGSPPDNCWDDASEPAFSPDGKSIAVRRSTMGIFIVGLDGSDPHQVTNVQKRGALEFEDFTPAFSPDGKRLVFERTRLEEDHTAVFVQPIDSSGQPEDARQITPWEMGCEDGPEFSPNGDWVLFSCTPEGGSSNLYIVHPDGTGLERLTNSPGDVHYVGSSFSPEFDDEGWGDIVAAHRPAYGGQGTPDVFGMHIDIEHGVQETVNLTKSETPEDAPSWGTYPPSARQ